MLAKFQFTTIKLTLLYVTISTHTKRRCTVDIKENCIFHYQIIHNHLFNKYKKYDTKNHFSNEKGMKNNYKKHDKKNEENIEK